MGKSFGFSFDLFESSVLALSGVSEAQTPFSCPESCSCDLVILTLVLHNEKGTSLKGMILMSTSARFSLIFLVSSYRTGTYLVVATTSWFKRCGTQLTPSLHRDK